MTGLPTWCRGLQSAAGPIYVAIADALERGVASGAVGEGDRLPTHRHLAASLGIDLTTATRAYALAAKRGLIEARTGRGTFIRPGASTARGERAVIDMTMNLPPTPEEPALAESLRQALRPLLARSDLPALMSYRWGAGTWDDRTAAAAWVAPNLGGIDPARVLVCPGTQSAMFAVATTYLARGDAILVEETTYPGICAIAAQLELRLIGVEIDGEGFIPESLQRALHVERPRMVYCNPTIQNPTTATMSLARRHEIARILARHDVVLLEDDAYGLFPANPLPALASLRAGLSFYAATTAKSLSPGLRVSYLVAPDLPAAERLGAALRASVLMQSGLLTTLVTHWIRSGEAAAMLGAIRRESASRQRLARAILGPAGVAHPDGLHVWLHLPPQWSSKLFTDHVRGWGVALVNAEAFSATGTPARAVRVALGAAQNHEQLTRTLHRLAATIAMAPVSTSEAVV